MTGRRCHPRGRRGDGRCQYHASECPPSPPAWAAALGPRHARQRNGPVLRLRNPCERHDRARLAIQRIQRPVGRRGGLGRNRNAGADPFPKPLQDRIGCERDDLVIRHRDRVAAKLPQRLPRGIAAPLEACLVGARREFGAEYGRRPGSQHVYRPGPKDGGQVGVVQAVSRCPEYADLAVVRIEPPQCRDGHRGERCDFRLVVQHRRGVLILPTHPAGDGEELTVSRIRHHADDRVG